MDWWMCQFTVAVTGSAQSVVYALKFLPQWKRCWIRYTCIVLWYEPLHVSRPWRERRPGSPLNPLTAKIRRTWKKVLPVSSKRAPRLG